jgi:hypothetical protein
MSRAIGLFAALLFSLISIPAIAQKPGAKPPVAAKAAPAADKAEEWHFVVSGDSRNCGDLIMPAIARDAEQFHPAFYWHLGDIRAIYEIDEDYAGELDTNGNQRLWDLGDYQGKAWDDFIQMQIQPFADLNIPFIVGIGNHETIMPMTRDKFLDKFAKWIGDSAMKTDPVANKEAQGSGSAKPTAYYRLSHGDVDFIYLDNSTDEQFDKTQLNWLKDTLEQDRTNPQTHTIVVGMHKALPGSISNFHSMSETIAGEQTGRCVYRELEKIQREDHKNVFVLSSHSHFIMTDIYNSPFWREHAKSILPGILVGTAGAVRYRLPEKGMPPLANKDAAACIKSGQKFCAQTDVYGYLLATVNPKGRPGAIKFEFRRIRESDVPDEVKQRFSPDTLNVCFMGNRQMTPSIDSTQTLPDGPCPF